MNNLQKLIELRGLTAQDIATGTGYGYHSVQKNVKGVRCNLNIREAIAKFLHIDASRTWGRGSMLYMRRLLAVEANLAANRHAEIAREKFLSTHSYTATQKSVNV